MEANATVEKMKQWENMVLVYDIPRMELFATTKQGDFAYWNQTLLATSKLPEFSTYPNIIKQRGIPQSLTWSPDGHYIVLLSLESYTRTTLITLFDARSRLVVHNMEIQRDVPYAWNGGAFTEDGAFVYLGFIPSSSLENIKTQVMKFNPKTRELVKLFIIPDIIKRLFNSPDGKKIGFESHKSNVHVWNGMDATYKTIIAPDVNHAQFSSDSKDVIISTFDSVQIHDAGTGTLKCKRSMKFPVETCDVGSNVYVSIVKTELVLWTPDQEEYHKFPVDHMMSHLTYCPTINQIYVYAIDDHSIQVLWFRD